MFSASHRHEAKCERVNSKLREQVRLEFTPSHSSAPLSPGDLIEQPRTASHLYERRSSTCRRSASYIVLGERQIRRHPRDARGKPQGGGGPTSRPTSSEGAETDAAGSCVRAVLGALSRARCLGLEAWLLLARCSESAERARDSAERAPYLTVSEAPSTCRCLSSHAKVSSNVGMMAPATGPARSIVGQNPR